MKTWIEKSDDERAVFANYCCELLVEKYEGDIEKACKNAKELIIHLEGNISNIYELIIENIPLLSLHEYDNDKEEYEWYLDDMGYDKRNARELIVKACERFYLE